MNWGDIHNSGLWALIGCLVGATVLIAGIWVLADLSHAWKRFGRWMTVSGGFLIIAGLMILLLRSMSAY